MNDSTLEKQARILVVQDDSILLGLVSGSLRPEGHDVLIAANPIEALSLTGLEYQGIDLILTRVNIKPISGLEYARRLARRGIDVPMLFMCASHSLVSVIANSMGHSSILEEPFTASELRASVKRCLSGAAANSA